MDTKVQVGLFHWCSARREVLHATLHILAPQSLSVGQVVLSFLPKQDDSSPSIYSVMPVFGFLIDLEN